MKIAVIGGGVSGLSVAQMLQKKNQEVVVFESEGRPGGMIKCDLVDGNLFHRTGGHVFNTKRKDVMEWFWTFFNREKEFVLAQRNSVVSMQNGKLICLFLKKVDSIFTLKINNSISVRNPLTLLPA